MFDFFEIIVKLKVEGRFMKRQVLCLLTMFMVVGHAPFAFAKASSSYSPVKYAIKKYKAGNFTGCLQDCQYIVSRDPSNSLAYYYMAMSYVQAGKKDEAVSAYSKVLTLKPNTQLFEYATTGKRCLETPEQCHLDTSAPSDTPELDKFIATPFNNNLAPGVKAEIEKKHLDAIRNEINSGKDVDEYDLRKLNDNSSEIKTDSVAQKVPSNDEVVAALRVLKAAGLSSFAQQANYTNPYAVQSDNYQSPEMAQISSMLGNNNNNKDNSMMNMLPFMLAQNKNGTSGGCTPQMMQAVIMNSMMPDFSIDTDKDK